MRLLPLPIERLEEARTLLSACLVWDPFIGQVAEEKLFGGNVDRPSLLIGAYDENDALIGLVAAAGRWIKLLAVADTHRRKGVGRALFEEVSRFAGPSARLRIADHPGNYLTPGVDPRYVDGLAFLRRLGFEEIGRTQNLSVRLLDNQATTRGNADRLGAACTAAGYTIRRAQADDGLALGAMITAAFAKAQAFEVARALEVGAVHIAIDGTSSIVAFAATSGNNQRLGWFGPAGTLPDHRRHGLGECLLAHCLADVAERGRDETIIAWAGPVDFYGRTVGARVERTFLQLERAP